MADGDYKLTKANSGGTFDEKTLASAENKVVAFDSNKDPVLLDGLKYAHLRLVEKATNLAVGTTVGGDFRLPFNCTILDVGAYVDTAGTTGNTVIDINIAGTSIMSTNKITIASTQKSSEDGGATQPTITTSSYTANQILTVDIDSISTTAPKGLVVWMKIKVS